MMSAPKTTFQTLLLASSCLVASSLLAVSPAAAQPTGGTVVSGKGTITTSGNTTTIDQTSNKALIDWDSFSIGRGQTVDFDAPGSNSITVNRVISSDPTKIFGDLLANGRVWLINGNGILFGKGSVVNVGSLIATTSDIADDDFRNGKYKFKKSGNPDAGVINKGTITASDGGSVVLSAAHVANEGVIRANLGTVVLGGANAFTVDLYGDNLIRYQVTSPVSKTPTGTGGALVSNSGKIEANGGTVLMTVRAAKNVQDDVINNSGIVEANSVSSHDGEIDLDAGDNGTVTDSGTLEVSGKKAGETGGNVTLTGQTVTVADGAHIDASGYAGGGTVLIGGNFHGQGSLEQAQTTTIGKAVIDVEATHKGDGGKVAIWSTGNTTFAGSIDASGGARGGNGGYVETSGHLLSLGSGTVNTLAAKGDTGMWLIDPFSVEICNSDCGDNGETTYLTTASIVNALANSDVTIEAFGNTSISTITIDPNSTISYNSANTLSFLAESSIQFESSVKNSGNGDINIVAGWDGETGITGTPTTGESNATVNMTAILTTPGAYGNNGANVTIGYTGANGTTISVGTHNGVTTVASDNLSVGLNGNSTANMQLGYAGAGGGDIDVYLTGNLTVQSDMGGFSQIGNGDASRQNTGATSVQGNILLDVAGNSTLNANGTHTAWIGNVAYNNSDTETGDVTWVTKTLNVESNGNANSTLLGDIVASDLIGAITTGGAGASGTGGGNVTIGLTTTAATDWGTYFANGLSYSNSSTLSLLTKGAMTISTSIENDEGSNINLIAGWNGTELDPADFTEAGVYGAAGGDITIGGSTATGDVNVGSGFGTVTVAGANVSVDSEAGFAQIGFVGANASGNITVDATGGVTLTANFTYAQIGNLGYGNTGNAGGNITVTAVGAVDLIAGDGAYAQIGNGGALSNTSPSGAIAYNGTIDVTAESVSLTAGSGAESYAQIGNGGAYSGYEGSGTHAVSYGGNITVTATSGNISLAGGDNNYALIGNGGSGSDDSTESGNILVNAEDGSITLAGSTDGGGQGGFAEIGQEGDGTKTGTITVEASANITLTGGASNDGGSGIGNAWAQIGSTGAGLINENISVTAGGNLTLTGGTGSGGVATDGAQIGNGGVGSLIFGNSGSNENGNINVNVTGTTTIASSTSGDDAWIGNLPPQGSTSTGTTLLKTGDLDVSDDALSDFPHMLSLDLGNGNTTVEITDSESDTAITGVDDYDSANTLKILSEGNLTIDGSIQNSGSGAIYLVAGWNGTTTDSSSLTNSGVYGNNEGSVLIGGEDGLGSVSVGSAGGSTTVAGYDITLEGDNGHAQIGFNGYGATTTGNIVVDASDGVTLDAIEGYAQIGNGGESRHGTYGGNISITAQAGIFVDGSTDDEASDAYAQIGNGGEDASGSTSGNITIHAPSINMTSDYGYAQIGNGGFGASGADSGNIDLELHDLQLVSDGTYAQVGDGGEDANGNFSGNITVNASLSVALLSTTGYTQIGNGGEGSNDADTAGSNSGNIMVTASGIELQGGDDGNDSYAQIGHGGSQSNQASGSNNTGNITVIATDGDIALTAGSSDGDSEADDSYAQIGMGGPFSGTGSGSQNTDSGKITVTAEHGSVALTASTDSNEENGYALIGDSGTAAKSGNITVTADSYQEEDETFGGNITLSGGAASGDQENSFAQIGDDNQGTVTANITVTAQGGLNLTGGSGTGDMAQIGSNGDSASVTGNVLVTVGGTTTIASSASSSDAWIGNGLQDSATLSGTTTLITNDLDTSGDELGDMAAFLGADLGGGNVTVELTDASANQYFEGVADYHSANTFELLAEGSLNIDGSIQNSGSGAVIVAAGWNGSATSLSALSASGAYGNNGGSVVIGGDNASGSVSVGSKSGTTTVLGDNITVESKYGNAQIGYSGDGSGDIAVLAKGNIVVTAGNGDCDGECYEGVAQIGNGGAYVTGNVRGNITVTTSGGSVTLAAGGNDGVAVIGELVEGGDENEHGNITVNTAGGALALQSTGAQTYAQIGDFSLGTNDGSVTANVTVDAGAVSLIANGSVSSAQIGSGDYLGASTDGSITGNITLDATTLRVSAISPGDSFEEARVGNLGGGAVSGTLDVTTTGNISIVSNGSGAASIGNFSDPYGEDGQEAGEGSGTVTVQSGGAILVTSNGEDAYASIEIGGADSGTVSVTAKNTITLSGTDDGGALIGSLDYDDGGVDVSVKSKKGDVVVEGTAGAYVEIGNIEFLGSGNVTGNVSVTATLGNITLSADGSGTSARIGSIGGYDGTVASNISLVAGGNVTLSATDGAYSQIGNFTQEETEGPEQSVNGTDTPTPAQVSGNISIVAGGTTTIDSDDESEAWIGNVGTGTVTGSLSLVTADLDTSGDLAGDLSQFLAADLSNGNVTLEITDPDSDTTIEGIGDYASANTLKILSEGSLTFTGDLQNSGSGDIDLVAGWNGASTSLSTILANPGTDFGENGQFIDIDGVSGGTAIGSASGKTVVAASSVTVDGDAAGYAQLGYHGAGGGSIDVQATNFVLVEATGNGTDGNSGLIGNGDFDGVGASGNATGNITVDAGGSITVEATASNQLAAIGNVTDDATSSESGNINISAGGALTVDTSASKAYAYIGDLSVDTTSGGANGDIDISAGNVTLEATANASQAIIGNGGFFTNDGSTGGNIVLDAASLTMIADGSGDAETRLADRGDGAVSGNITANITGNILLNAESDGSLVSIGNGEAGTATSAGNITVSSGGNISITAEDSGQARIAAGVAPDSAIDVTAKGDILLQVTGTPKDGSTGAEAYIGTFTDGDSSAGGNVSVVSQHGSVELNVDEDYGYAVIGNTSGTESTGSVKVSAANGNIEILTSGDHSIAVIGNEGDYGPSSGTVTLTAGGNLTISATGSDAVAQLGNGGADMDGNTSGNITVNAGALTISAGSGAYAVLGNGDPLQSGKGGASGDISVDVSGLTDLSGSGLVWIGNLADPGSVESGNVTILTGDEKDHGAVDFGNILAGDLSGGNVTVGLTGSTGTKVLDGDISYDSANALTLLSTGSLELTGDIQNSGSGAITVVAGWNASVAPSAVLTTAGAYGNNGGSVTIGGNAATGNAVFGSAGGTTTILADNVSIDADNGDAQLGYAGTGTGLIDVVAKGAVSFGSAGSFVAQIGDGATLDSSAGGGAVDITAASLSVTGNGDVAGQSASIDLTGSGGSLGSASHALDVAVKDLAIATQDGDAYVDSKSGLSLGVGSDGIDLGTGTLTLTADGSVTQTQAITAGGLDVTSTAGSITLTDTGNSFGTADISTSGSKDASLYDASALTISGADVGGSLILTDEGNIGQSGAIAAKTLHATSTGGAIALTDASNAVSALSLSAKGAASFYDSVSLTVDSVSADGLTLLGEGNLTFVSSIQLKNGALLAVAGWDGHSTSASALAQSGAYGNNGGSIVIGGANASGGVAVGSADGSVTLEGDNVSLDATNGYAQIGYRGTADSAIDVLARKNVTLAGGVSGDYAQIGNGGFGVSGNESGAITVDAGDVVALDGGAGSNAYAQIGNGGAEGDKNSSGYTNAGDITVEGATVALEAGAGNASYAQIGNGGYDLGDGLTGQGINSGNITVTASNGVSLTGNGTNAYAQIGDGGEKVNANSGAHAGGSNSGNITVDAGTGSLAMTAGSGNASYVQIGNGGYASNSPTSAPAGNFSDSGTITVSDLTLTGSDTGNDGYAQIGNGDASQTGEGNVSGNITIQSGNITLTSGTATGASASIANATGKGSVSGTVTGYGTSSSVTDPAIVGAIDSITTQTPTATNQQLNLVIVTPEVTGAPDNQTLANTTTTAPTTSPLQQLADSSGGSGETPQGSDKASDALGQSLSGHHPASQTIIPGVLTEVSSSGTAHGIPPADQDYSSWGNEAYWQW